MKSKLAFWSGVIFVAALPLAIVLQITVGANAEAVVHFAFAAGCGLLVGTAWDHAGFRRDIESTASANADATCIRRPLIGSVGIAVSALLGVTFLLQGISNCIENDQLHLIAFGILGQWPERVLVDAVVLWLAAIWFYGSRGKLRIFGLITFAACAAVELYNIYLNFHGTAIHIELPILKIVFLTPFVWLLLESRTGKIDNIQKADFKKV